MQINPAIFKAYDIRGIYPTDLNEENIIPITRAFFKFFTDTIKKDGQLTVVLAYDMRLSGPQLYAAVKKTLVEMGAQVIDIGQASTPTFYFAVSHYGYDCGIQVTASHNPKEYNGMKAVKNSPEGLIKIGKPTGMEDIKRMAMEGVEFNLKYDGTITEKDGVLEDEVENALTILDHPKINKFKIVADPANAMGISYLNALFEKVPADLIKMNFDLDGSFPSHQPDPLNFDNLKDLQQKVLAEHADFGVAPDGDGDRMFFVDDKGRVVPATIITALVAKALLKEHPGAKIIIDIRCILTPQKIIEENGGQFEYTRVGHAFITEKVKETGAIFAGEVSGHYYYKETGGAESQVTTLVSVLKVLTEEGKKLSEIVEELRRSYESGEINFKVNNASEILDALKEKYKDAEFSFLDGVSISYPDWRANLRTSNTEPLLRLNVEAYDQKVMEQKRDEILEFIKTLIK